MRKLDLYWMSHHDWWGVKDMVPTLKDDAPEDAQISYDHYCIQQGLDCIGCVLEMQETLLRKENGSNTEDILFLYWYLWDLLQQMYAADDELKAVRIYRAALKNKQIILLLRKYHAWL